MNYELYSYFTLLIYIYPQLIQQVLHDAVTVLRGWMSVSFGDQERLFFPYTIEPLTLHWEELFTSLIEDLLEIAYSSLLNSNVKWFLYM